VPKNHVIQLQKSLLIVATCKNSGSTYYVNHGLWTNCQSLMPQTLQSQLSILRSRCYTYQTHCRLYPVNIIYTVL